MQATLPPFNCIILAGGEGRRVGGMDKGLIELDGKTYIEHVIDNIKNKTEDIIISANRNIDTYQTFCDKVIQDACSSYQGPLSGITTCLPYCKHDWVLIVPCDMPYLPENIVNQLFETINSEDIAIASVNKRHQLVLLIKKSLHATLQEAMANNQLKLIKWVESQNYCQVNFDNEYQYFRNLNTLGTSG